MFLFLCKKSILWFYFDNIKQNMRTNQILRILHFRRSTKFHCIKTMWNVLNFHSNSTVCHKSTPESDDSNEFHSVEFLSESQVHFNSTFFSTVGFSDFQFHINYTLIPQLVSWRCISNVELETSTILY